VSGARKEIATIVLSMVATCAVGAAILGGVYVATSRHTAEARRVGEEREVSTLLALDKGASVTEIDQLLDAAHRQVIYRVASAGAEGRPLELRFDFDGAPRATAAAGPAAGAGSAANERLVPLGRIFVARRGGAPAGFVVEGTTQGYKSRIRFLVGLRPDFEIAGVRVVELEEDPGLGAEIATPEFSGQFTGRTASAATLAVTRDPLPEDWRAALSELRRMPAAAWLPRHRALLAREREQPIHAVTGATISSRALADGVRVTLERFRSRWERIAPYLERVPTPMSPVSAAVSPGAASAGGAR
jgi:electron transport complex protein RnfG